MNKIALAFLLPLITCTHLSAAEFQLKSSDITANKFMKKDQEFQGFGCEGGNKSPQLSWSGAPSGTKAYAIMAYDPDAPSGSGWWHWQAVNIPLEVTSISSGTGHFNNKDVIEIKNDYGQTGFGGACPPKGHGIHHYQFTVYALSQKLDLPPNASAALTGYMVKAHSLASSTIVALYQK
ncbi:MULTISPECIES: YbhB/YbcL family Raf kinase inhibitor-like protein [Acinetobacter calcoaceticus/baumannii complex]|uniref:YbhB/YbcL family Raf kinase inhibitor-like protein n=1 Tax=Acinetobacter calcoaceticus/baumannii complex TaxID=909768 RepID=UPI000F76F5CF|nr:YbhB/YbcL family Raf kinase inhibitor-like protein [Acinetobacter lactucae]RSO36898.1 YbhB/YbcL family Raf kinase inhibitor-like protein [Acinetobacter lactucae]